MGYWPGWPLGTTTIKVTSVNHSNKCRGDVVSQSPDLIFNSRIHPYAASVGGHQMQNDTQRPSLFSS